MTNKINDTDNSLIISFLRITNVEKEKVRTDKQTDRQTEKKTKRVTD